MLGTLPLAMPLSASNAEEQRAAQEQEAALTSHLFATGTGRSGAWWSIHVEAWRKSGLSRRKYCREHRLCEETFTRW